MSAGEEWDKLLGTIGAGNHFAELQVVEAFTPPKLTTDSDKEGCVIRETDVVLLVHSGSRGYGGDILKRYTAGGSVSIHESDPKAIEYMEEHDRACGWAEKSRDLIALRFLACLEPGDDTWELGINNDSLTSTQAIQAAKTNLHHRKVVDIWHNNVEKASWPPKPPPPNPNPEDLPLATSTLTISDPDHEHSKVYIHRKGAAPTHDPTTSLPLSILPLPGSRGTPTIILHPTFSASTDWGVKNGLSLAHGAGRAMSRAKAATWVAGKYKGRTDDLLRGGDGGKMNAAGNRTTTTSSSVGGGVNRMIGGEEVHGGTWVVCEDKSLVWEEAPEAYKDVYAVCGDLVREGVACAVGWCRARVSYKVRNE